MLFALVVPSLVTPACAHSPGDVTHQFFASHNEYAAYRRFRTSQRIDLRLVSALAYIDEYPQGRWVQEVEPWFKRAELGYWLRIKHSEEGLTKYLQTLPSGPHAVHAAAALAFYHQHRQAKAREIQEIHAANTEERLALLAKQREQAVDLFTSWLVRLLSITSWQRPTSSLDHGFLYAWRIDAPQARCLDNECKKTIEHRFQVLGGGDEADRLLMMDVVLVLRNGVVEQAQLRGPELFSRVFEAWTKRSLKINPLALRVEAIAYAISVVAGVIEGKMPGERCGVETVSPVVLRRECEGWRVEVVVGDGLEEDDVVVIRGPGGE